METEPLLSVNGLKVELDGRQILHDLSFRLQERDVLAILGPNGAGKTVLLRALLDLIPHEGEVKWRPGIRIGYVPQRVPINKEFPVSVEDFFAMKGVSSRKAAELLSEVGLDSRLILRTQLGVLSSGQFQRVLIAWAMSKDPDVLIFDEPTAGVDVGGESAVHAFLERTREKRGFAIILVTHDLTTIQRDTTQVLRISEGRSRA